MGKTSSFLHGTLYGNLSLVVVRRLFLKIFIYLGIAVWIKELYQYFFNTKGNYSVLMFGTIIVAHFFTGILSANELEEIYMVLYLPWVIAIIFNSLCINKLLKNTVVLIGIWAEFYFPYHAKYIFRLIGRVGENFLLHRIMFGLQLRDLRG